MINKKITTRDFAGGSFHQNNEGECEEPGASNSEAGVYDERREPTIKHTSDFGGIGELYIAGWQQFEDATCDKKFGSRITPRNSHSLFRFSHGKISSNYFDFSVWFLRQNFHHKYHKLDREGV